MRADIETRFVIAAVDKIFLDGVQQMYVLMFDDDMGMIQRYKLDKNGDIEYNRKSGEVFREVMYGKVEVTLNTGWSWENGAFRIDVMKSATNWRRNEC